MLIYRGVIGNFSSARWRAYESLVTCLVAVDRSGSLAKPFLCQSVGSQGLPTPLDMHHPPCLANEPFGLLWTCPTKRRRSGFIEAMVVSSKRRRDGVATQLLHRILDDARASGCHKIQLLTHRRHATDGAHAFYRSMGFESEAEGFRRYLDSDQS